MTVDLSTLTDEQLAELERQVKGTNGGPLPAAQAAPTLAPAVHEPPDMSQYTDEEIDAMHAATHYFNLGKMGHKVMDHVIIPLSRAVDSVTGAPTRAAVSAFTKQPEPGLALMQGAQAFGQHFGGNPETAPSPMEQAHDMGIPDTALSTKIPGAFSETGEGLSLKRGGPLDLTASGSTAEGLNAVEDWTNLLPLLAAAKGAAKTGAAVGAKGARMGAQALAGAADVLTGTRGASKGVEVARGAVGASKDAVEAMFSHSISPDFNRSAAVAVQNGIDPKVLSSAIEFGPGSAISRKERQFAEGPLGADQLAAHAEGSRQIQTAMQRKMEAIGRGPVLSEVEAGRMIRQGYQDQAKKFFEKMDMTHDRITSPTVAPGLYINRGARSELDSAMNGVEKFAKGRVARGITDTQRGQGTQLLRAVAAYRRGNGTYKQAVEALRDIGSVAFDAKNSLADVPPDTAKLRDMYFAINDALITTVKKDVSPDFARELVQNNAAMTDFFKQKSKIAGVIGSQSLSDEGVFRNLVLNGDTQKIGALRAIFKDSPQTIDQLKGAMLNSLVKRNADGTFSFDVLNNALRSKKTNLEALFRPDELSEIADLVKLGKDHGLPILSTSGTGASNSFRKLWDAVPREVVDKQYLENMKARARGATKPTTDPLADLIRKAAGGGSPVPPPPGTSGPYNVGSIPVMVPPTPGRTPIAKQLGRTPLDLRLKALQMVAPPDYPDKKKRVKALGGQ